MCVILVYYIKNFKSESRGDQYKFLIIKLKPFFTWNLGTRLSSSVQTSFKSDGLCQESSILGLNLDSILWKVFQKAWPFCAIYNVAFLAINNANKAVSKTGVSNSNFWRATFQKNMLRGPQFIRKKLPRAAIYKKSTQNKLFDQYL